MKPLFTVILSLFSTYAFCQSTHLYNADGILKADTRFSINKKSLKRANEIEQQLTPFLIKGIKYPAHAREDSLSGTSIIKFSAKKGEVKYEVITFTDSTFRQAVLGFLKLQSQSDLFKILGRKKITFYVPIAFMIVNEDDVREGPPGYIPIKGLAAIKLKMLLGEAFINPHSNQ